jgi:hypothetical protein
MKQKAKISKPTIEIFLDESINFKIKKPKLKTAKMIKSPLGLRLFEMFCQNYLANIKIEAFEHASLGIADQKAISRFLDTAIIDKSVSMDRDFLESFLGKLSKNNMTDVAATVLELIARFNATQILKAMGKNAVPKLKFAGAHADKKFLIFRLKYHLKNWS